MNQTEDARKFLEENLETITSDITKELQGVINHRHTYKGFKRKEYERYLIGRIHEIVNDMYGDDAEEAMLISCDDEIIKLTNQIIKNILGDV